MRAAGGPITLQALARSGPWARACQRRPGAWTAAVAERRPTNRPAKRGCEAEREDTDDGHAPGRPRLTRMPPAARMAGPTRATRHPCLWRGPTLDVLRLRGLCARPGGRQILRRDAHGLGDCRQQNTRRCIGCDVDASLMVTVFSSPSTFSSCSLFSPHHGSLACSIQRFVSTVAACWLPLRHAVIECMHCYCILRLAKECHEVLRACRERCQRFSAKGLPCCW